MSQKGAPRWIYPRLAHGLVFMVSGRYLRYITIVLILFSECSLTWEPTKGRKLALGHGLPHTMFMLESAIQGEEKLLRGEVLAIVVAIRTRCAAWPV